MASQDLMHVLSQDKLAQSGYCNRANWVLSRSDRGVLRRSPNGENLLRQQNREDHGVDEGRDGERYPDPVFRLNHLPQAEMNRILRVPARARQLLVLHRAADPAQSEKDYRRDEKHPDDTSNNDPIQRMDLLTALGLPCA